MPARSHDGFERMKAFAQELPNAFADGFRAGRAFAIPNRDGSTCLFGAGMGASGIVADLARSLVEAETSVDLNVTRGPQLPRAVDGGARVLLTSYSGNTWETLRAYDDAGRAGAARTVVTSGGELAERAEADGVPVLRVPQGLPPRSAIGHLLGGTLGVLDSIFPESNEGRVALVTERVRSGVGRLVAPGGPAAAVADGIGERLPFVYAGTSFAALARRWKTQVEENAKRIAVFDEVPEMLHNAIVGWDAITPSEASRYAVVLLEWAGEDPGIRASFRYLERLLRARKVKTVKPPVLPEDRLEALLEGLALGDVASLFLAKRRRVDPFPVDAITRLKAWKSKTDPVAQATTPPTAR